MDVTLGEAPYLRAYRMGGEAKEDFVKETNGPHGSAVGTSLPHTINYLLTRYAPEDALQTAEMARRTAEQRQDEGERAFYQRLMPLGRQLMGMYDPGQLRYLFLKGLHPSVQAQAELADRTCTTFDELVALSQKIGDGLRAVKVTIGKADRYTKAKSVLQLGSGSGAKIEPVLWAAPPAKMPPSDEAPVETVPSAKRRRKKRLSQKVVPKEPARPFVAARVRALYERLADLKRVQPLVKSRTKSKVGEFNTVRLRALQEFVLSVGGAGLSLEEQRQLYEFLEIWDGTKAGMSAEDADGAPVTDTFGSPSAFRNALREDADAAVNEAGWLKCTMSEGGESYTDFFTPVLEAAIDAISSSKRMR